MKNIPTYDNFIKSYLIEMATPSSEMKNKLWFHGTNKEHIDDIIKDGYLKPSALVNTRTKRLMAPVYGKVYLTADVYEAMQYAYFRSKPNDIPYLIVVDGKSLKDVQPDEDIIADLLQTEDTIKGFEWLLDVAKRVDSALYKKFQHIGDYAYSVSLAKKIVKTLSDNQKIELINNGFKLAHGGEIPIKEVWELPTKVDNIGTLDYKTQGKQIY